MSMLKKMVSLGFQREEITQETILSCAKTIIGLLPSTGAFFINNHDLIERIDTFNLLLERKGVRGVTSTNYNRPTYSQLSDFENLMNAFHEALDKKTINIYDRITLKKDKKHLTSVIEEFKSMHKLPTGKGKNRDCVIL